MIDSNDRERISEARDELHRMLSEVSDHVPIVQENVFSNMQLVYYQPSKVKWWELKKFEKLHFYGIHHGYIMRKHLNLYKREEDRK